MGLLNRLVLRMQSTNTHRLIHSGQPQAVTHPHLTGQRRAGDHQTGPFHGKGTIDSQTKAVMVRMSAGRELLQMGAQSINSLPLGGHGDKQRRVSKAKVAQGGEHLVAHRLHPGVVDAVGFGQGYRQLRVAGQLEDLQVLARLRHYPVIAGHHQQGMVNPTDPGQHVGQKLLVPRHVDKSQHLAIRLRPVGITQIYGHAALLLFRQAVGVDAGDRLQQGGFAVVNMTGGGNNHFNNISRN